MTAVNILAPGVKLHSHDNNHNVAAGVKLHNESMCSESIAQRCKTALLVRADQARYTCKTKWAPECAALPVAFVLLTFLPRPGQQCVTVMLEHRLSLKGKQEKIVMNASW